MDKDIKQTGTGNRPISKCIPIWNHRCRCEMYPLIYGV